MCVRHLFVQFVFEHRNSLMCLANRKGFCHSFSTVITAPFSLHAEMWQQTKSQIKKQTTNSIERLREEKRVLVGNPIGLHGIQRTLFDSYINNGGSMHDARLPK